MFKEIKILRPNDMHVHFRDGEQLSFTVNESSKNFNYVIAMPNLSPPILSFKDAINYHERIVSVNKHADFYPLVTLFLNVNLTKEDVEEASKDPRVAGVKLYPNGVTTNSKSNINGLEDIYQILEKLERFDLPLQVHGESTRKNLDIFDREKYFIDDLDLVVRKFPALRIVFEHISTKEAVSFVNDSSDKIAATITPQHMMLNRNDLLSGGIKPHNYCLPILKREEHRDAVCKAAVSGSEKFFLGTDSAPHFKKDKESNCGCAGIFSAHTALELYVAKFEELGKLESLEKFTTLNSCKFYNLEKPKTTIVLERKEYLIPTEFGVGTQTIVPFMAGEKINWQIKNKSL
ncbi:MAG: dihydroorotase [Nitrosomonadales bacterium]